jgi:hypothetical protein
MKVSCRYNNKPHQLNDECENIAVTTELSMTQLAALEDRMREACNSYVPPARPIPAEIIAKAWGQSHVPSRFTMLALDLFGENGYSTEEAILYISAARKEIERNVAQGG